MSRKIHLFSLLFLCLIVTYLPGQEDHVLQIHRTNEKINLDGQLTEMVWESADSVYQFWNHRPVDSTLAEASTLVKVLFDDQFMYFGVRCKQASNRYVLQSLKRDRFWGSDAFGVVLDPIHRKNNGFFFGINAGGAQTEGLIDTDNLNVNWDGPWYSKVFRYPDSTWEAEMAIPLKTLRFQSENRDWGINFVRADMKRNQYSTWTNFPVNFDELDLGFTGTLHWPESPPIANKRVVVMPYAAAQYSDLKEEKKGDFNWDLGLDSKIAMTPTLNLDLTFNPDFSQVEVDRQVINLTRFNLFFPERRAFFLENSDLFSNLGFWEVRPFFSRRIGLENGSPIPIIFGARLSGNVNSNLRIGLMSVQTAKKEDLASQNYTVATAQVQVLKRSNIKTFFTNFQDFPGDEVASRSNRVGGLELNFISENGKWNNEIRYHRAFLDEETTNSHYYGAKIDYNSKRWRFLTTGDQVGQDYLPEMGFAPRLFHYDPLRDTTVRIGYFNQYTHLGYHFYPKKGKSVVFHGPRFDNQLYFNKQGRLTEGYTHFVYELDMANQSQIDFGLTRNFVELFFPFNPLGSENELLPVDRYHYTEYFFDYDSDPRPWISAGTVILFGEFYTGRRLSLNNYLRIRIQPWVNVELRYIYNHVDLDNYGKGDLHLFAPRVEVSFSNQLFWTTFFQYNTQANNFNINSRVQWRYRPMSDIFLVFGNNYEIPGFFQKDIAFSFKLTSYF